LDALPGKVALIKRTYRPPTSRRHWSTSRTEFTPNNAFVRWHRQESQVSLRDWRLNVGGDAAGKATTYDMATLKRDFEQVELAAVAFVPAIAGMFQPHVPGVALSDGQRQMEGRPVARLRTRRGSIQRRRRPRSTGPIAEPWR
jgi:hypothetical protein